MTRVGAYDANSKEIQGRRIRIEHAKRQRGHEKTPGKCTTSVLLCLLPLPFIEHHD